MRKLLLLFTLYSLLFTLYTLLLLSFLLSFFHSLFSFSSRSQSANARRFFVRSYSPLKKFQLFLVATSTSDSGGFAASFRRLMILDMDWISGGGGGCLSAGATGRRWSSYAPLWCIRPARVHNLEVLVLLALPLLALISSFASTPLSRRTSPSSPWHSSPPRQCLAGSFRIELPRYRPF